MEKAIEIIDFPAEDYMPLKDYGAWRVAVLRHCENTNLERISWMQKHMETDEVFALLDGNCTLILAGDGDKPENYEMVKMEPHKLYNIKSGFWHNHVLDENGEVLIVENRDTTDDNSPTYHMDNGEIAAFQKAFRA